MPKILKEDNFLAVELKSLYYDAVIYSFNNKHNANNNDCDVFNFFEKKVKPYFNAIIANYDGVAYFEKLLLIIQEIRNKILNNIVISLDDISSVNLLGHIDDAIKSQIKDFIIKHKDSLKKMHVNCDCCDEFRELINHILGKIDKFNINQVNTDPWLAAWRFLDPKNNRRVCEKKDFNACYINNPFSFNTAGELLSSNVRVNNFINEVYDYGGYLLEAVVVYYLATQFSPDGFLLSNEEQERRFIIYATTLTESLRCYNQHDFQGVDLPSCPGGMISRFVEQCGYEPSIQFISKRTFINNVISEVVCNRVHEMLSNYTTTVEVLDLLNCLCTGFSPDGQLKIIETTPRLRKQRYLLFNATNNNERFFELIKNEIKEQTEDHGNEVMINFHHRIQEYCFQDFEKSFLNLPHSNSAITTFIREFRLIGYAFSDPAYCCYSRILNMCLAKLQQFNPYNTPMVSPETAALLCEQVIREIQYNMPESSLFASGFMRADLTIIIESYKNGIHKKESDPIFIDRIIKSSYQDYDELGKEEEIPGLDSIMSSSLLNRNAVIHNIAHKILNKIRNNLTVEQLEEHTSLEDEESCQILLGKTARPYTPTLDSKKSDFKIPAPTDPSSSSSLSMELKCLKF